MARGIGCTCFGTRTRAVDLSKVLFIVAHVRSTDVMEHLGGITGVGELADAFLNTGTAGIVIALSGYRSAKALIVSGSEGGLVGEYAPAQQQEDQR